MPQPCQGFTTRDNLKSLWDDDSRKGKKVIEQKLKNINRFNRQKIRAANRRKKKVLSRLKKHPWSQHLCVYCWASKFNLTLKKEEGDKQEGNFQCMSLILLQPHKSLQRLSSFSKLRMNREELRQSETPQLNSRWKYETKKYRKK